jgi:hypothetical protein
MAHKRFYYSNSSILSFPLLFCLPYGNYYDWVIGEITSKICKSKNDYKEEAMTPEEAKGWEKFFRWRWYKLEKLWEFEPSRFKRFLKQRIMCSCIKSVDNPSQRDSIDNIFLRVCKKHAKEFGISSGPYLLEYFKDLPKSRNYRIFRGS